MVSNFRYITTDQLDDLIPQIEVGTLPAELAEAERIISEAELIVDKYCRPGRLFTLEQTGTVEAVGSNYLDSNIFNTEFANYHSVGGQYIEFIEGDAEGDEYQILSSTTSQRATVTENFSTAPAVGDEFRLYQKSVFPRFFHQDTQGRPRLPVGLKEGVAAQIEYWITIGETLEFNDPRFIRAGQDVKEEEIGDWRTIYFDNRRKNGLHLISPKAELYLKPLRITHGRVG